MPKWRQEPARFYYQCVSYSGLNKYAYHLDIMQTGCLPSWYSKERLIAAASSGPTYAAPWYSKERLIAVLNLMLKNKN